MLFNIRVLLFVKVFIWTFANKPLQLNDAMIPECPRDGDSRNRTRIQQSPAAEPSQGRSVSGLLSEIKTTVNNEPFTDHYAIIPGKELGR